MGGREDGTTGGREDRTGQEDERMEGMRTGKR